MMRAALGVVSLSVCVVVVACRWTAATSERPTTAPLTEHTSLSTGTIARALSVITPARRAAEDHEETRRRIRDGQAGTYIGDVLAGRDSSLSRWPDRRGIPLTVWIQPQAKI